MKTTKAQKILDMTAEGVSAIQIAKKMGVSPAYVYVVRSKAKKKSGKAKKKSRIVEAVTEVKQALDKIEVGTNIGGLTLRKLPDGMMTWKKEINPDPINHPPHYTKGGIETIDFIEAKDLNYRLGNVVKYVSRAGKKDSDPVQDLEKAAWYLQREIDARKRA